MWETRSDCMHKRVSSHMQIGHATAHHAAQHVLPKHWCYLPLRAQLQKKKTHTPTLLKIPFQHILPHLRATQTPETHFEPLQTTAARVTQAPDRARWWWEQRRQEGCNHSVGIAEHQGTRWWRPRTAQQRSQLPPFPPHIQDQTKKHQYYHTVGGSKNLNPALSSARFHTWSPPLFIMRNNTQVFCKHVKLKECFGLGSTEGEKAFRYMKRMARWRYITSPKEKKNKPPHHTS